LRRALVTGITGQDGSYLAELLLAKGYELHAITRDPARKLRDTLIGRVAIHTADLADTNSLRSAVSAARADEVFHLAAQTHVQDSFNAPEVAAEVTGLGTLRVLEAVRALTPASRVFVAVSSEIFGRPASLPQDETSPICPVNPYAAAKAYAFHLVSTYRQAHDMFVSSAILFNHESPRRRNNFVTQRIADGAARIAAGLDTKLTLGALEVRRDWGFAGDYVDAMWRTLQHETPGDYVVATGVSHSVRDFCEAAFARVNLDYRDYVISDAALLRPTDIAETRGDATKARRVLGWTPQLAFEDLVHMMVDARKIRVEARH
jgi:GDPmannose 4,6-dehydratase